MTFKNTNLKLNLSFAKNIRKFKITKNWKIENILIHPLFKIFIPFLNLNLIPKFIQAPNITP